MDDAYILRKQRRLKDPRFGERLDHSQEDETSGRTALTHLQLGDFQRDSAPTNQHHCLVIFRQEGKVPTSLQNMSTRSHPCEMGKNPVPSPGRFEYLGTVLLRAAECKRRGREAWATGQQSRTLPTGGAVICLFSSCVKTSLHENGISLGRFL